MKRRQSWRGRGMSVDWEALRREFPSLDGWTFLNSATYGQTPRCAYEAVQRHFARRTELACNDFLSWFDDADQVRRGIGRLIGCEEDDIAFIPTAGAALSLLLNGIDWQGGEQIVTLTNEFPNNLYGPALLEKQGVQFVEVPWDGFWEAAGRKETRLVAISTVSYSTGFRPPVEEISRFCHDRGILLYVDGTQSVGALKMNVSEFQPAMMAVDAYKWMLTPNGAGFVYVSKETREWLKPANIGWRSHWDWRSVDNLHHGAPEFSQKAERYEGGMLPFPMLYALGAVVDMMLGLGAEEIERRVLGLAGEVRRTLRARGAEVSEGPSQIVTARFADRDASELARALKRERIQVSARQGRLRISPHFYNNEAELERLAAAL